MTNEQVDERDDPANWPDGAPWLKRGAEFDTTNWAHRFPHDQCWCVVGVDNSYVEKIMRGQTDQSCEFTAPSSYDDVPPSRDKTIGESGVEHWTQAGRTMTVRVRDDGLVLVAKEGLHALLAAAGYSQVASRAPRGDPSQHDTQKNYPTDFYPEGVEARP